MTAPQTKELAPAAEQGLVSTAPAAAPQFFRGFEGAAVEPFPEAARRVLAAEVDPRDVEIKPDGIVFLPGVAWRRILTRAFGAGGWAILPRSPARVMGTIVVYHGALVALGRFVAEAVGECFYRENNPNMSYASCVEGAKTDALSRCCKDLGIATELWDANWREQWKKKYATSYETTNRKTGDKETKWKLRDRVSNPHDLMAGAGGVAPPADPPRSPSASQATESASSPGADPADAPSSGQAPSTPSTDSIAPDTGEAATVAQLDAVKGEVKRLKWKLGYMRIWFAERFGFRTDGVEPARLLGALSAQQADTALVLLQAFGTNVYDPTLAKMQEAGRCR